MPDTIGSPIEIPQERPASETEGRSFELEPSRETPSPKTESKPLTENSATPAFPASPLPTPSVPAPKTVLRHRIEKILEEDLIPLYTELTPDQKKVFRAEGEKSAIAIETMMQKTKVKVSAMIGIIRHWLSLLPGVNRFFLEQEAKIKADKILFLRDKDFPS